MLDFPADLHRFKYRKFTRIYKGKITGNQRKESAEISWKILEFSRRSSEIEIPQIYAEL